MRNTWLVARREYLERVRTKAFIVSTILIPVLMAAFTVVPTLLATRKGSTPRHVAVVASNAAFGELVSQEMRKRTGPNYTIEVVTDTSDAERDALKGKMASGALD